MCVWVLLLLILFSILSIFYLIKLNENYYILSLCKRIKTIDRSRLEDKVVIIPGVTRFGNNFDLLNMTSEKMFNFSRESKAYAKGKSYLYHFLFASVYNIITAEEAEEVLQSTKIITKSVIYDLMKPFLGDGLLISTDNKWHFRRKMLTPAFHFNVLQSFIKIFKDESLKLLKKLQTFESNEIDVIDVITEFSLNSICETALGIKLDNIPGSTEYRKIIHEIETIIVSRLNNPLMLKNWVFNLFGEFKKHRDSIQIAHDFSSKIIETKRREYLARPNDTETLNEYGLKKRYAMLDTLLEVEAANGFIDHQGICDEVNTFMFEGFDTTATCIIFTILNLSLYPEVQQKCRKEVQDLLPHYSSTTVFDFNKLEYLECVIKETLRLFPSVPFIGRKCIMETKVNGLILPANTDINIHIYDIMRDSRHFPEPNAFKPERFSLEATSQKNPFAFVPFSAGPRNCIGQKFAMLEIKAVLVAILQNFEILPITKVEDLVFSSGLVLRTQQKIYVKLKKI